MLAVLFGIKCKKKVLAKQNKAKKSASTIGKRLLPTSQVVYQPINHRNLSCIAFI